MKTRTSIIAVRERLILLLRGTPLHIESLFAPLHQQNEHFTHLLGVAHDQVGF